MRGIDHRQSHMFSYLSPEERVRKDHPLRAIRTMVDEVLRALSPQFDRMYASEGRPSMPRHHGHNFFHHAAFSCDFCCTGCCEAAAASFAP